MVLVHRIAENVRMVQNFVFFADSVGAYENLNGGEIMISSMQQLYHVIVHLINHYGCGLHMKKA